MFKVVFIMGMGVLTGYLLRNKPRISKLPSYIHLIVCVMLFFLGISVGLNKMIVERLGYFCGQAFIISGLSILGSACASLLIYNLFYKKK